LYHFLTESLAFLVTWLNCERILMLS